MATRGPSISHLITNEPEVFSAVTVFERNRRRIVHNDGHNPARQNSNLAHELAHGLLLHPPTPALDDKGCRQWNQDIEDEASWLGGILLVTEAAAIAVAKGQWTREEAMERFGVSRQMLQFRLNATGAIKRVQRLSRFR
jgi:Zn-dependent peptidase ImmA (M78 family)